MTVIFTELQTCNHVFVCGTSSSSYVLKRWGCCVPYFLLLFFLKTLFESYLHMLVILIEHDVEEETKSGSSPPPPQPTHPPPTPLPHTPITHPGTQKATICAEGMWRWNETQGLLVGWWSLGDLTLQQARKMPSLVWLSFTPNKASGVWLSLGPWLVTRLPSSASWWCWESWCLDSPSLVGCFYSSPPVLSFFRIWNVLKKTVTALKYCMFDVWWHTWKKERVV